MSCDSLVDRSKDEATASARRVPAARRDAIRRVSETGRADGTIALPAIRRFVSMPIF
jgi:hypothetical protein